MKPSRLLSILAAVFIALSPLKAVQAIGGLAKDAAGAKLCHVQGQPLIHISAPSGHDSDDDTGCADLCAHLLHAVLLSLYGDDPLASFIWRPVAATPFFGAVARPPNPPPQILPI